MGALCHSYIPRNCIMVEWYDLNEIIAIVLVLVLVVGVVLNV